MMNNHGTSLKLVAEPNLRFGFGQETAFAKDGLLWFGPLDVSQKPTSMRIGVISSPQGLVIYKKWVAQINLPISPAKEADQHVQFPGFDAVFGCVWPNEPVCALTIPEKDLLGAIRIKDRYQAIYNTVSLFESEIRRYRNEEDATVDLWFVLIPEEIYKYGRPQSVIPNELSVTSPRQMNTRLAGRLRQQPSMFSEDNEVAELYRYEKHFHNQLKARLLSSKAVIQVVRETTLAPEDFLIKGRPVRQLQDKASVAWNLCTTAYFKVSGRPWKLANVRAGVCYVGLVFKQDDTGDDIRNACCGAQMFLDSGDGVVFRGAVGPWYSEITGEFHLSREKAKLIAEQVVATYKRDHGSPPKELFIHGKTLIDQDEWDGFREGVPDSTNVVAIRIRHENQLKLYSSGKSPLVRGSYVELHQKKGYLWTKGFVPRLGTYQGREVPNPLAIEISHGEAPIEQVMTDILGLTKINFNRCDFADGEPVTLRFADQVGEILTAIPTAHDVPPLPFKHYI